MVKLKSYMDKLDKWVPTHILGLFTINMTTMVLVLLKTNDYFLPYFLISTNFIMFVILILSVILLQARNRAMVTVACLFWTLALVFKLAHIDIWAERAAIYAFDALVIGIFCLVIKFRSKV